jgi:HAD superfamily hydrolase (TIGR01509 family)
VGDAGVIFDFDGVIADSEPLQYAAYSRVLQEFGVSVTREEYGREWIAAGRGPEYAVKQYALPLTADEVKRRKNPIYHELLRSSVTLMPGVPEALRRLSAEFPLALATNSFEVDACFVLDRFELRQYFTALVTRECYDEPKPAPDAFLAAAAALRRAPRHCVVIEDAEKGILSAARAGCPTIAVRPARWQRSRAPAGRCRRGAPRCVHRMLRTCGSAPVHRGRP